MFKIDHPNILKLKLTLYDNDYYYFLLEYAQNGSLAGFMDKRRKEQLKFTLEQINYIGAQLALMIYTLQECRVIHRDMKPHNILLDDHFRCILADFGDAIHLPAGKVSFRDEDFGSAHFSSYCGTPYYMSPEMITDWETCNGNDIWAR